MQGLENSSLFSQNKLGIQVSDNSIESCLKEIEFLSITELNGVGTFKCISILPFLQTTVNLL